MVKFAPYLSFWVWFVLAFIALLFGYFVIGFATTIGFLAWYSLFGVLFIYGEMVWACDYETNLTWYKCFLKSIHNTPATPVLYIMLVTGWFVSIMAFLVY